MTPQKRLSLLAAGAVLLPAIAAISFLMPAVAAEEKIEADLCLVPPGAQPSLPATLLAGQGAVQMPVTTMSSEAHAFFNQGVAQLHSFWASEAERSFLQAAPLDPDMAMAYWGIATAAAGDHRSSFQNLRDRSGKGRGGSGKPDAAKKVERTVNGAAIDAKTRAREAIEKAMSLRDTVTPRERLYIEAQWARRNPTTEDPDADFIAACASSSPRIPTISKRSRFSAWRCSTATCCRKKSRARTRWKASRCSRRSSRTTTTSAPITT